MELKRTLKKTAYIVCAVLAGLFIVFEALSVSLFVMAFTPNFYKRSFAREGTAEDNSLNLNDAELMIVMKDVLSYMWGDGREWLDTEITVIDAESGEEKVLRVFFDDPENPGAPEDSIQVRHMKDVKDIIIVFKILMFAGLGVIPLLLFTLHFLYPEKKNKYRKLLMWTLIAVGAFLVFLAAAMLINFDATFEVFHKILFTNDDWMFSADDILLQMVGNVFMRLGFRIAGMFFGLLLLALLATIFSPKIIAAVKKRRRKKRTPQEESV